MGFSAYGFFIRGGTLPVNPSETKAMGKPKAALRSRDVSRSKQMARRKPVPEEFVVALISACFKADVKNCGYVAPPDEVIEGLLADGLGKYLRDRYAVHRWVKDQAYRGWLSGASCVRPAAFGPVRGPGGTFCTTDASRQVLLDRVHLISAKDAGLLQTADLEALRRSLTRIMSHQAPAPLLQELGSIEETIGKDVTFYDRHHGHADLSENTVAFYNTIQTSGLLAGVRRIAIEYLKQRNIDPACFARVPPEFSTVFAHSYESGQDPRKPRHGLGPHVDDVAYCAAVYSVTGDNGAPGLWWSVSKESQELIKVPMEAGDIVLILRGTLHGVTVCDRLEDRMTLNFHL